MSKPAEQLERIAAVVPPKSDVAIYELDDGRGPWPFWLCPPCRDAKVAEGWVEKSRKDAPRVLPCDGCGVGKLEKGATK
jgi:hypothetical protein